MTSTDKGRLLRNVLANLPLWSSSQTHPSDHTWPSHSINVLTMWRKSMKLLQGVSSSSKHEHLIYLAWGLFTLLKLTLIRPLKRPPIMSRDWLKKLPTRALWLDSQMNLPIVPTTHQETSNWVQFLKYFFATYQISPLLGRSIFEVEEIIEPNFSD